MNCQVKAILFRKGEKGKTTHKSINVQSFKDLVYSDEYKAKLDEGKLLGLFTHLGRSDARSNNLPHCDNVAAHDHLCNILRGIEEDDDCIYGCFELVDTDAAKRFKDLVKMGVDIGVSISTELVEGADEFFIKKFHGVDFTLEPEFSSKMVSYNFSAKDASGKTRINVQSPDFSINEYIRDASLSPAAILKLRIQEVTRYTRFNRAKTVEERRPELRSYISSFIRNYISKVIANGGSFNIAIGLRLDQYLKDKSPLRILQVNLKRAQGQLKDIGYMSSDIQKSIDRSYKEIMDQIYDYIADAAKIGGNKKL